MRLEVQILPDTPASSSRMQEAKQANLRILPSWNSKNVEIVKRIGWRTAATMDTVEEKAAKLNGFVDGIIATCAGDAEGDKEMLQKLQKFRS